MVKISKWSDCAGSRERGLKYENIAQHYLQRQGLLFLARNVVFRCGELDLIMLDKHTLVFVEVRFRRNTKFGDAAATINWQKRQKLIHCAACWLNQYKQSIDNTDCRFDVVVITGNQLQWLKNAFGRDD